MQPRLLLRAGHRGVRPLVPRRGAARAQRGLLHVVQRLGHLAVLGLWQHDGEAAGDDRHGGEDEGGDGGVDVRQGRHRG